MKRVTIFASTKKLLMKKRQTKSQAQYETFICFALLIGSYVAVSIFNLIINLF